MQDVSARVPCTFHRRHPNHPISSSNRPELTWCLDKHNNLKNNVNDKVHVGNRDSAHGFRPFGFRGLTFGFVGSYGWSFELQSEVIWKRG
jgi:hypothetical protein